MKLAGYLRVSSKEMQDEGQGVELQRLALVRSLRGTGNSVVAWATDEGVSGTLAAEDRPGLSEVLGLLRDRKVHGVAVRDLDRLARSVTVQEATLAAIWAQGGAVFTTAGEEPKDDPNDPMRTAMREMAGVFSGLERRLVIKRMRDGRLAKAARGEHASGCYPYGWAKGGRRDPRAQAALARMVELAGAGVSTREIAAALVAEGFPTQRGGQWSSPVVSRILSRARAGAVTAA